MGLLDFLKKIDAKIKYPDNPYLQEWATRKEQTFIMSMPDLPFVSIFDFSSITAYTTGIQNDRPMYYLENKNKDIAVSEILALNQFMPKGHKITEKKIAFSIPKDNETLGYTKLMLPPLTKTGKIPKYPVELFFSSKADKFGMSNLHGTIKYLQDGKRGDVTVYYFENGECKKIRAT